MAEQKSKPSVDMSKMKTYYLVLLLKGPNREQDSTQAARIQEAHLAHLNRLAEQGKLAIAGPVLDEQELRGICIYNVGSAEEARILAESDPAVKAGRLKAEVHPWMSQRGANLP
jgi:uncharacterized protein YciI